MNAGCGSAAGVRLPPFVVYKAKHLYDTWKHGGSPGALYGAFSSGWMERPNFLSWFTKLLLKYVELLLYDGPVILFVDGHHSHIDLELIYTAREHNLSTTPSVWLHKITFTLLSTLSIVGTK